MTVFLVLYIPLLFIPFSILMNHCHQWSQTLVRNKHGPITQILIIIKLTVSCLETLLHIRRNEKFRTAAQVYIKFTQKDRNACQIYVSEMDITIGNHL